MSAPFPHRVSLDSQLTSERLPNGNQSSCACVLHTVEPCEHFGGTL